MSPRAAARFYIVLGLLALVGGGVLALFPQLLLRGAAMADATVVALRGNDKLGYVPVIQFTGPGGSLVRWSGTAGSTPAAYAVGAHLRVVYLPSNPGAVAIAGFWRLYAPAIATFVFAGLFLAFGLLGLRATRPGSET
jgi:hypothetical protein